MPVNPYVKKSSRLVHLKDRGMVYPLSSRPENDTLHHRRESLWKVDLVGYGMCQPKTNCKDELSTRTERIKRSITSKCRQRPERCKSLTGPITKKWVGTGKSERRKEIQRGNPSVQNSQDTVGLLILDRWPFQINDKEDRVLVPQGHTGSDLGFCWIFE